MSGVLNHAIAGLQRVIKRGLAFLAEPKRDQAAKARWLMYANPLPAFLDQRVVREGSCLDRRTSTPRTPPGRQEMGITMTQQQLTFRRNLESSGGQGEARQPWSKGHRFAAEDWPLIR